MPRRFFRYGPLTRRAVVTSTFGFQEAFRPKPHGGVDFRAPVGTPVYAVAPGVVITSTFDEGGGGEYLRLHHPKLGVDTQYLHLSRRDVSVGMTVRAGQQIGLTGNTGASQAPHLHFDARLPGAGSERVDPAKYLPTMYRLKPELAQQLGVSFVGTHHRRNVVSAAVAVALLLGVWWWRR